MTEYVRFHFMWFSGFSLTPKLTPGSEPPGQRCVRPALRQEFLGRRAGLCSVDPGFLTVQGHTLFDLSPYPLSCQRETLINSFPGDLSEQMIDPVRTEMEFTHKTFAERG